MTKTVTTMALPGRGFGTTKATYYVRITGDATSARIETAPFVLPSVKPSERADIEAAWTPEEVPGTVTIRPDGTVTIDSSAIDAACASELALTYGRCLRDARLIEPDGLRYSIGHAYVALDAAQAERLSKVAGYAITTTPATVVHGTSTWALWSDGSITTAIGLPQWAREINSLSADAASLISAVRGSDSGAPRVGWNALLSVIEVLSQETVESGLSIGHYAKPQIQRMRVRLKNGETPTWWLFTEGYEEGYVYELHPSRESLMRAIAPPPPQWIKPEGQLWEPCPRCGKEPVLMPLHLCAECYPEAPSPNPGRSSSEVKP